MGKYFDYSDWQLEEICDNIRERLEDTKVPIPPKVKKHGINIVYKIGEGCYNYPNYGYFSYDIIPKFKIRKEAEDYLNQFSWLKRIDENNWEEIPPKDTYTDKNGSIHNCTYQIREYDYEEYEDGETYYEYTEEEKKKLTETLYFIEKARAYLKAYDYACDEYDFGEGRYVHNLNKELDKFEKEFLNKNKEI